ncbi:unnamed protein product [Boreogadus saida]
MLVCHCSIEGCITIVEKGLWKPPFVSRSLLRHHDSDKRISASANSALALSSVAVHGAVVCRCPLVSCRMSLSMCCPLSLSMVLSSVAVHVLSSVAVFCRCPWC